MEMTVQPNGSSRGFCPAPPQVLDADEVLVTVGEVARRLRLSRPSIYRLTASGELPSMRLGRSIRFAPSAVAAYLKAKSSLPAVR